jgi:MFS family permease
MASSGSGALAAGDRAHLTRAVLASTIGTSIEWYDYFAYGTVGALVFPKLFFPESDPLTGTLDTFSIFFVGFIARPIGALIFGNYGDRIGRKAMLIATLILMGLGTALIGVLPGRASIGIAAPLLLTLFRVFQGLGVGGEWGGSVILSMEWGGNRRRGFITSWPQFGVPVGLLLSTAVVAAMQVIAPGPAFDAWGWRVPFLLSIILIGIGLWIRLGILETPIFRKLMEAGRLERQPMLEAIRQNWREILLSAILRLPEQAPFYIFTTFVYTFGAYLKITKGFILLAVVVAALIELVGVPTFGWLSDSIGRKTMYLIGAAVMGVWGFVYFGLYATAVLPVVFAVVALSLVPHAAQYGPQAALIAENFTGRLRYSGASLGYQLASVIAGGPAPLIATAIWGATRNPYWIGAYILLCAVLGIIATLLIADRSKSDITVEYDQQEKPIATS